MTVYDYLEYKPFLRDLIQGMPRSGRGQARKLAEFLSVNSVVVSQILSGERHFTVEQGLKVTKFFGMDERSAEYFLLLVQLARAGTIELEDYYKKKLAILRRENLNLKNRVVEHHELSETDKGIFYSNWFFSGIRLLTSVEGFHTVDEIANHFGLTPAKVAEVLQFLVSTGLCVEKEGKLTMGPTVTYVGAGSPFINSHRRNWRLRGLERFSELREGDMFYSGPCSLSAKDAETIRKELVKLIADFSKVIKDSKSEKLYCLNVDWFQF